MLGAIIPYLPIVVAAAIATIGIADKWTGTPAFSFRGWSRRQWQNEGWKPRSLLILTAVSLVAGLYIADQKRRADAQVRELSSVINVQPNRPVDHSILVMGIDDSNRDDDSEILDSRGVRVDDYLIQYLFPRARDGTHVGSVAIVGDGLRPNEFAFIACGSSLIVEEANRKGVERYLLESYIGPERRAECNSDVRAVDRGDEEGGQPDTWVFDGVAGGVAHVADVNTGQNAQIIFDYAEQTKTVATITVNGIADMAVYQDFISDWITFELKFYQRLIDLNPLGEGCTGVYAIPLVAAFRQLDESSLEIALAAGRAGTYRRCELSPI